jgi:hypothetical protein
MQKFMLGLSAWQRGAIGPERTFVDQAEDQFPSSPILVLKESLLERVDRRSP